MPCVTYDVAGDAPVTDPETDPGEKPRRNPTATDPLTGPTTEADAGHTDRLYSRLVRPMPRGGWVGWAGPLAVGVVAAIIRLVHLSRPDRLIFDETYYAKDALSLLRFGHARAFVDDADEMILEGNLDAFTGEPSFVVHPSIGKWLIALGIRVFGMDSFGWRIVPALCGVVLVVLLARAGRRLFRSNIAGTAAGLFVAVDGMSIVLSRTALLDGILAMFVVAAFAALLVDRDRTRRRYADWALERLAAEESVGAGPALWWRPWRLTAGVLLGLACATKWNGLYALAVFGLLTVFWEVGARRAIGVGGGSRLSIPSSLRASLRLDAPIAFVTMVGTAVAVYIVSWWGWFTAEDSWSRQWGVENPASGLGALVPDALRSLWHYHGEMYEFHSTLTSEHDYESSAWGWLLMRRPVSFDYTGSDQGEGGCTVERCSQEVLALGTPVLWWGGCVAIVVCIGLWLIRRDWRAGAILAGICATWVPWLAFPERTTFAFYAVVIAPFIALAVVHVLHTLIGGRHVSRARHVVGWSIAVVFGAAVLWMAWYFYPIWVDHLMPYSEWQDRMWWDNWI